MLLHLLLVCPDLLSCFYFQITTPVDLASLDVTVVSVLKSIIAVMVILTALIDQTKEIVVRPVFLLVDLREFFFRLRVGGLLTGHFQSFFSYVQKKNSKTSEVNQQFVFNLYTFHHFPENLDRPITFNSVTLTNTQTEPQKISIF